MLIALVMLMTSLIPSFTVNAAFSDVEDTNPYNKAIATLSSLNVINGYGDGTFLPNKEITRAEFTKMVVFMLGKDNLTTPITTFNDVSADHWANAYIKTAYDLGIINGFDEVTFKPDAPVTYEQALKMLVCTLGYGQFAEAMGGYPDGYRSQASSLKLTDLVTGVGYTDNAPRGIIAQIMYNALEVDMYEVINGALQNSKKNLLNDYLNVEGVEGTLVAVGDAQTSEAAGTTVYPSQIAIKDRKSNEVVVVDYTQSEFTEAQLAASLGRMVQVYYRQDGMSSDKFLIAFTSEAQKGSEMTIYSVNVVSFDGTSLKYYTEDGTDTVKIDSNPSIRYNGKPASITLTDYLDPDNTSTFFYGTVRLVNDGTSNSFNMVEIYDYEVVVAARGVSSSDYLLTDKYKAPSSTPVSFRLKPNYDDFTITKNGTEVEPTSISTNDVVLYADSLDVPPYKTIKVSNKSVSGKIDAINTTKQTIRINGTDYNYSLYFWNYMNDVEQRLPMAGETIKAYTDDFGTLQWGTVTSSEEYMPYAFALSAVIDSRDGYVTMFAPKNKITSFTSSTPYEVNEFPVSESVKLNGAKSSDDAIVSALSTPQFVRVGFNASDEITSIITVDGTTGVENTNSSKLVKYTSSDTNSTLTSTALKQNGAIKHPIKSSTPLFVIPMTEEGDVDISDIDGFALKNTISSTSLKVNEPYEIESYDVDKSQYPAFMAYYKPYGDTSVTSGTPISVDTSFSAIDSINQEYDPATEESYDVIYSYTASTETSPKRLADTYTGSADVGDIALFGYDKGGYINEIVTAIDYDDVKAVLEDPTKDYDWSSGFNGIGKTDGSKKTTYAMYNVIKASESQLFVTSNPFTSEGEPAELIAPNYDVILNITSSTKILRYNASLNGGKGGFTPYLDDSDAFLTISDIRDADTDVLNCSKIAALVYDNPSVSTPQVRMIVIYE